MDYKLKMFAYKLEKSIIALFDMPFMIIYYVLKYNVR